MDNEYCCEFVRRVMENNGKWRLGSHYHCANCNGLSGMYGHYHGLHFVKGKFVKVEPHFGCSDKCSNRLDYNAADMVQL